MAHVIEFPTGARASIHRNGSTSHARKDGTVIRKNVIVFHLHGVPKKDFKVPILLEEEDVEDSLLEDIVQLFKELIRVADSEPTPDAVVEQVLSPLNITLYNPQFQKHLTDDALRPMLHKRLATMLRESAAVLFPTAPWAAQCMMEARKPWPMPARRAPDGSIIEDVPMDGDVSMVLDGDVNGLTPSSSLKRGRASIDTLPMDTPVSVEKLDTPKPSRRSRVYTPVPGFVAGGSGEPMLPPWYSHTQIVHTGYIATLAASMLPELQSDLTSVLVAVGVAVERQAQIDASASLSILPSHTDDVTANHALNTLTGAVDHVVSQ